MICRSHVAIGVIDARMRAIAIWGIVEIWGLRGRRQESVGGDVIKNLRTRASVSHYLACF
jgi:hypothetical protein